MLYQSPLPPEYASLESGEIHARIAARKRELGGALCILGHHYQSDDVIQYADFVGDSLKLSQQAAGKSDARYIVFCGVHFMAESADVLSQGRAAVILPHMMAGCGMADMAEDDAVALAIDEVRHLSGGAKIVPVSYVNSTAAIKALTARAGGSCCTSSNVRNVFAWALGCSTGILPVSSCVEGAPPSRAAGILPASGSSSVPPQQDAGKMPAAHEAKMASAHAGKMPATRQDTGGTPVERMGKMPMPQQQQDMGETPMLQVKILAVPDQHLALNTALAMGYSTDECVVYDPKLYRGGLTGEDVRRARFILWKGQCYVHQRFTPAQVRAVRQQHPGIRVIVHPECPSEVVALADASGSTEQIIRAVTASPPGNAWAIGTESNLVNRLAKRLPDRFIRTLGDSASLCIQMARIDPVHLLWVLDNLAAGTVVNQVTVPADIAADARIALERMISIKPVV